MYPFIENPAAFPPAPILLPVDGDDVDQATFANWLNNIVNRTANLFQNTTNVRLSSPGGTYTNVTESVIALSGTTASATDTSFTLADAATGQLKLVMLDARFSDPVAVVKFKNHLGTVVWTWTPERNVQIKGIGVLRKTSATNWTFYTYGVTYSGGMEVAVAGTGGSPAQIIRGPGDVWLSNSDASVNSSALSITIDPPLHPTSTKRIHLSKQLRGTSFGLYTNGVGTVTFHTWEPGVESATVNLQANSLSTTWSVASITQRASTSTLEISAYPGTSNVPVDHHDFINGQFSVPNAGSFNVILPSFAMNDREFTMRVRGLDVGGQCALRKPDGSFMISHFASTFARDNIVMSAKMVNGTWRATHSSSLPAGSIVTYDNVLEHS